MRVRLKVSRSGLEVQPAGSEVEVSAEEAQRLFDADHAEPVRSVKVERATAPPAERAVTRAAKRRAPKK